mgnify:CR=1 FL=1
MGYLGGTAGLKVNNPAMISGADAQYASANYIAQDALAAGLGLYEPDVDPEITRRYGRDDLQGLLSQVTGYSKAVTGRMEFNHYEKDFIHGLVFATTSGGSDSAVFTLESDSEFDLSYDLAPQSSTGSASTTVPRERDIIQLPNRFECFVHSVDRAAGTFVAYSIDGTNIPSVSSSDEIIIKGNIQPEFADKMETRHSRLLTYRNNLAEHKSSFSASGRALTETSYIKDFGYAGGGKGDVWYLEGMSDEYHRFQNECNMMAFDGKKLANANLTALVGRETLLKSEGLITTIENSGTNVTYTTLTLANLNSMSDNLMKFKGDKRNMLFDGYEFQKQFNSLNRNGDGTELGAADSPVRVSYGVSAMEEKMLNLDYKGVTFNGFTYLTNTANTLSDPTTLGATGQGYSEMGLVLPMGDTVTYNDLNPAGSSEKVKSIRVRYKDGGKGGANGYYHEWETGAYSPNGKTNISELTVNMEATRGLELFALNRFGKFDK